MLAGVCACRCVYDSKRLRQGRWIELERTIIKLFEKARENVSFSLKERKRGRGTEEERNREKDVDVEKDSEVVGTDCKQTSACV